MPMLLNSCLIFILSYGFLDIALLGYDKFNIIVYLMIMSLFYTRYCINKIQIIITFFVLSMLNFSQDFVYLTNRREGLFTGIIVITGTFCFNKNKLIWKRILENMLVADFYREIYTKIL